MKQNKIRFQRDYQNSFLILEDCREEIIQSYEGKMVLHNKISGLAECEIKKIDNAYEVWYLISSRQALSQIYAVKELKFEDIKVILIQIGLILRELEKYLLDAKQICFSPEYLFWNMELNQAVFMYDFSEINTDEFKKLAEFMIERTDHNDEKAVDLAYYFYDIHKKDNFSFAQVLEYIDSLEVKKEVIQEIISISSEEEKAETKEIMEEKKESISETQMKLERIIALSCIIAGLILFVLYGIFIQIYIFSEQEQIVWISGSVLLLLFGTGFLLHPLWEKKFLKEVKDMEEKKEPVSQTVAEAFVYENRKEEFIQNTEDDGKTIYIGREIKNKDRYLILEKSGKEMKYLIKEYPFIIGKEEKRVNLALKDHSVSRIHAKFMEEDGTIFLEDLHSTNGTSLNDLMLNPHEKRRVKSGDIICFGKTEFIFR